MASTPRSNKKETQLMRPATTPEARESQLVSLAYDVAEKQMRDGTASSQVISHFLKFGTAREALEQEKLRGENQLLHAKIESMASMQRIEELYANAIEAMRGYSGQSESPFDDYDG